MYANMLTVATPLYMSKHNFIRVCTFNYDKHTLVLLIIMVNDENKYHIQMEDLTGVIISLRRV